MYLLNTDLEELNARYEILYKQTKTTNYKSIQQINRECDVLLEKYNFEIEELNALREVEYKTQHAKIEARNYEEIPFRRSWLWRLLFQPVTNRPQDNIEEEAAQNAEQLFAPIEAQLARRAAELYGADVKELSRRKRKKMLKKFIPNKDLLELTLNAIDELYNASEALTAADDKQNAAQLNDVNAQKAASEQLEAIIQEADNVTPGEAFEQPEPPAEPKPKRKHKSKAPKLSPEDNAALQDELQKRFEEPGDVELELKPMKSNGPAAPGQLPGQIGLNEITGDDS